jgi:hypothetical protein
MSSYVVADETINRILTHFQAEQFKPAPLQAPACVAGYDLTDDSDVFRLGCSFRRMNELAVNAKNRIAVADDPYAFSRVAVPSRVEAYKALRCFLYQCNGKPTSKSAAFVQLNDYCQLLARSIIEALPEFEKAKWG